MKKLTLLASMLLMTYYSFSQTDTTVSTTVQTPLAPQKTLSLSNLRKDTIIGIPKTLVLYLIQDAIKSDSYAEEIVLLRKGLDIKQEVIGKQDTIIQLQKSKEVKYKEQLNACNELVGEHEIKIAGLETNLRKKTKAKRFWCTVAITAVSSIIITHYSWKESVPW